MKKTLIITKQYTPDLELFINSNSYELVFLNSDSINSHITTYGQEEHQYDEIWVWDLYFDKLPQVLYCILNQTKENNQAVKKLKVYTNSIVAINAIGLESNCAIDIVPLPIANDVLTNNFSVTNGTYLDMLIKHVVTKVVAFRDEIASRWPTYFETQKIYLAANDYVHLSTTCEKEFTSYLAQGTNNVSIDFERIIFSILSKSGIQFEIDEHKSSNAISKLFFDEVLYSWVSGTKPVASTVEDYETIETHIAHIIADKESQETVSIGTAIENLEERTAENKNGPFQYFVSEKREESIIIINALGLSIDIWEPLISLLREQYQVLVWETRCGDIEEGGMESVTSIDEHAEDIQSIITQEQLDHTHIIGWCNGARIGIKVAHNNPVIKSLMLLAPVFKGIRGFEPSNTLFEVQLDNVFGQVKKTPKKANILAKFFEKMIDKNPKIESLEDAELLSYSDRELNPLIFVPMCSADYLINYAQRSENDENYEIRSLIEELDQEVLLILGENDSVVSNKLIKQVGTIFQNKQEIMIKGGSHYMQVQNTRLLYDVIDLFLKKTSKLRLLSNRIVQTAVNELEEFQL